MASQKELDGVYMGTALLHASISKGVRAKVGAVLVTRTGIIMPGVNGLPKTLGNVLELASVGSDGQTILTTKAEVIHAEQACLNKCAREGVSCESSILYVTMAPCLHCASNMIASGIKEVIFKDDYRDMSGVEMLEKHLSVRKFIL